MRSTISMSVKPVLLGGGRLSLKVAFSLFVRYVVSSCVFVKDMPFYSRFLTFASFKPLPKSKNDQFTLMALDHFVNEYGEATFLLIPCDKECLNLVKRNKDTLENKFIIRTPSEILEKRDLFPLTATNGKDF